MITTTLPILKLAIADIPDQGVLGIMDLSTYAVALNSSNVSMQITPPGYNTINVTFNPGSVNIYKCADLGITCSAGECCPLPDGIYDVLYSITAIQGAAIDKTFIKIDQIKCKFQHAFLKIHFECDCGKDEQLEYKRKLDSIDMLIAGSVAAANDCNPVASFKLYQKADFMLDGLSCAMGFGCDNDVFKCPSCQ